MFCSLFPIFSSMLLFMSSLLCLPRPCVCLLYEFGCCFDQRPVATAHFCPVHLRFVPVSSPDKVFLMFDLVCLCLVFFFAFCVLALHPASYFCSYIHLFFYVSTHHTLACWNVTRAHLTLNRIQWLQQTNRQNLVQNVYVTITDIFLVTLSIHSKKQFQGPVGKHH